MNADELRAALLRGDLSRPRLTWYDDNTGERIDLSGKTLANWVAKAANWLESEMALAPGDDLHLAIPPDHWRAIYWSLAAWTRGLTLSTTGNAAAVVGWDVDAQTADLIEPAAALAKSPLQAMPDLMPPPAGRVPCEGVEAVEAVPSDSRVLVSDGSPERVPGLVAGLIGRECSVLVLRGADERSRSARIASEAVDLVL